jgi:hypothetical protein
MKEPSPASQRIVVEAFSQVLRQLRVAITFTY